MLDSSTDKNVNVKRIAAAWGCVFKKGAKTYTVADPRKIHKARSHPIVRFIVRYCRLSGSECILEAGCGGGIYGLAPASLGCECVEFDYLQQMLQNVEVVCTNYESRYNKLKVTALHGDLTDLHRLQSSFDIVFNEGVVEHWVETEDRKRILAEMVRSTKLGGFVVVCIPNNSYPLYSWWYLIQRVFHS